MEKEELEQEEPRGVLRTQDEMERRSWNSPRRFHDGGNGSVAKVELARLKSKAEEKPLDE